MTFSAFFYFVISEGIQFFIRNFKAIKKIIYGNSEKKYSINFKPYCFASRVFYFLLAFFSLLNLTIYSQAQWEWARNAGNSVDQQSRGIAIDPSGNVITVGFIRSSNNNFSSNMITASNDAIYISKYDANGNYLWAVKAGSSGDDQGYAVAVDASGSIYITGFFESSGSFFGFPTVNITSTGLRDIFVAKYDPSGNALWAKKAGSTGNDRGLSITTNGSDVYVTGLYSGIAIFGTLTPIVSNGSTDVFIASYNATNGLENWVVSGGSAFADSGNGIAIDASGVYVTGSYGNGICTFQNHPGSLASIGVDDIFIVKYDLSGNGIWKHNAGTSAGSDAGTSIAVNTNSVYIAGYFNGTCDFYNIPGPPSYTLSGTGTEDALLAQYDAATGNINWAVSENGTSNDRATSVAANPSGDVFITGYFGGTLPNYALTSTGGNDGFISKYNSSGTPVWTKQISGTLNENPSGIAAPTPAIEYITGWLQSAPANFDLVTVNSFGADDIFFSKLNCSVPAAIAGSNQLFCASSTTTTLAGNSPTVGTGTWSLLSGTASISTPTSPVSNVTSLVPGIHILQWSVDNYACPAPTTSTMSITVDQIPTTSLAGPNQTLCASNPTTTMNGNSPLAGIGTWTLISGSASIITPSSSVSSIASLNVGTNVFEWSIKNGVCPASTSTMNILVDQVPTTAVAGANQTLCASNPTFTMLGNTPSTGTGSWTVISGTGSITNPTLATSGVTAIGTGTNIFRWAISNGVCSSSSSTMSIIVDQVPTTATAGSSQTLCSASYNMGGNAPAIGTGTWTLLSGSATITAPNNPATSVTSLGVGNNIFQWAISNGACAASTSTVSITRDAVPTTAIAGFNQNLCASSPTTNMTGNTPAIGTGSWTVITGTANITSATSGTTAVTAIATGTNIFMWIISNGVCPSSSSAMNIIVDQIPTIASAGSNQTLCASNPTFAMLGNTPGVGTGSWTVVSGTATITSPTLETTGVTSIAPGTNIFQWAISNGTCTTSASTMSIVVDQIPTAALAGPNQTLCASNPTFTMSGNTPGIGTGLWTIINGTASISSPTLETTGITAIAWGTTIFEWAINNGVCATSTSTMSIVVDQIPTTALAGSDQTLCASAATLNAGYPLVGTGNWSLLVGTSSITNPNLNTTQITNLNIGLNSFMWAISNGTCATSYDTVAIFVSNFPDVSVTASDYSICETDTIAINANTPAAGTGMWSVMQGSGIIANTSGNATSVTAFGFGDNIFRWTITNAPCSNTFDDIKVTVYQKPTVAFAGDDQLVFTEKTILNANIPLVGNGDWINLNSNNWFTNIALHNTEANNLDTGSNTFVWRIQNGVCPVTSDTIIVTREDVVIPNGFSPNGDNVNDYFYVKGIESLGNVSLTVFNRWGNVVYENSAYNNSWKGENGDGKELTDDTYYFILKQEDAKEIKGYVIIKK